MKNDLKNRLNSILKNFPRLFIDLDRKTLIKKAVDNKEALVSANGALVTWTPTDSTGRSPKDTLIVQHPESKHKIDWDSPNNIPLEPETFDMILEDALKTIETKSELFVTNRVLGADSAYALPVKTITDKALTALFTDNMFRPVPDDLEKSIFAKKEFTLIALPYDKLDGNKYKGKLRTLPNGKTTDMVIGMDFDRR
ncbi:MAG: phosphoenolpyruvate carboxykinase (ATP), partial [Candidatus Cloacimonas sp. 4484_275]